MFRIIHGSGRAAKNGEGLGTPITQGGCGGGGEGGGLAMCTISASFVTGKAEYLLRVTNFYVKLEHLQ